MFYGFDIYYFVLVVPALIFTVYAQFKVKGTFNKYRSYNNWRGYTGADVAREILNRNGLYNVAVEPTPGELTDHYDPRTRVVRLSEVVYHSTSLAAIGVAAHETGHAIQHKVGYAPLVLRSTLIPAANIGTTLGFPLAFIGFFMGFPQLINIGIILYTAAVAFLVVTLPVEFNASSRARSILEASGAFSRDELVPVKKVLNAAAMTYVAAALVAIANLLRLVLLANNRRDE